jgi:hypothetical protein
MSKNGDFVFPVFQKIQKMVIFFKKMWRKEKNISIFLS